MHLKTQMSRYFGSRGRVTCLIHKGLSQKYLKIVDKGLTGRIVRDKLIRNKAIQIRVD